MSCSPEWACCPDWCYRTCHFVIARYEGRIVQEVIRADGGTGQYTELTPPMLGIWDTLVDGTAEATWVSKRGGVSSCGTHGKAVTC